MAKTTCARCGELAWRNSKSSRAETICHECRRKNPAPYGPRSGSPSYRDSSGKYRIDAVCEQCGEPFKSRRNGHSPTGWTRYCSLACAGLAHRKVPRELARRNNWANMSEEARHRKRQKARARHRNRQLTGDGITDEQILERDRWMCRMDTCIYGSRRINPKRKYPDQRSASIDHILPLSLGGDDTQYNKRAAHLGCNMARGQGRPGEQLPMTFGLDLDAALEPRWAKQARRCGICSEPVKGKRCRRHMPVHYSTCQACERLFVHGKGNYVYCSTECSQSARNAKHDEQLQHRPAHKRGLEAAKLRAEGLDWWQIADQLGYSGGQYAAAAAARALGQSSPRRTAPYVRTPRVGQQLSA